MTVQTKAMISLVMTVILFSLVVIVARVSVVNTPQSVVLFLRMLVALIVFLPFFIKGQVWQKKGFKKLTLVSFLSTVNVLFFMWGIKYTTASASQLIYAAQPVLTIVITGIFWGEKYNATKIIGVLLGLMGVGIIIFSSAIEKGETIVGGLTGNFAMVIAMSGWLLYILLSKKISQNFSPVEIGSTSILVSFIVSFIFCIIQLHILKENIILTPSLVLASLYLGLFGTFGTYMLMQYSIRHLSSLTVNLTSYIQPMLVTLLAIILLGERMTPAFIFGGVLVFTGVFITASMEYLHRRKNR